MRLLSSVFLVAGLSSSAHANTLMHCNDRYGDMFFSDSKIIKTDEEIRYELTTYTRDENDEISSGLKYAHPQFEIEGNPVIKLVATGETKQFGNKCDVRNGLVDCRINPTQITLTYADGSEREFSAWNTWFALHEITKRTFTGTLRKTLVSEFYGSVDGDSVHPSVGFRYHRCEVGH